MNFSLIHFVLQWTGCSRIATNTTACTETWNQYHFSRDGHTLHFPRSRISKIWIIDALSHLTFSVSILLSPWISLPHYNTWHAFMVTIVSQSGPYHSLVHFSTSSVAYSKKFHLKHQGDMQHLKSNSTTSVTYTWRVVFSHLQKIITSSHAATKLI